jgi:hypothetical protein
VRATIQWLGDGVSPRGDPIEFKLPENPMPGAYDLEINDLIRGGYYLVRFTARGSGFERETQTIFAISPASAQFERIISPAPRARVEGTPGNYSALIIESTVTAPRPGSFAVAVTLHAQGKVVASLTSPLTLEPGLQTVSVSIPGRDIRVRGIDGPYTVNLTLLDTNWAAIQIDELTNILTISDYHVNDFS